MGERLIEALMCLAVVFGLIVGFGVPAMVGLWLYFAMNLPPVALWIGGIIYVALALVFLMFLSWASRLWPEPLRKAFDKVLAGPWYLNF